MASASSTSARSLFADSKMRLADRVQINVNNISSLARQITRGSKSNEVRIGNLFFVIISLEIFLDFDALCKKFRCTRADNG